jgi:Trk K+ transport system NAD-binding subunit
MSTDTAITMSPMSRYAILGCGSVGHAVAEELAAEEKEVVIIDHDQGRVDALRDQDLDARRYDIRDSEVAETLDDFDVVLILSSDVEANATAVENLRVGPGFR